MLARGNPRATGLPAPAAIPGFQPGFIVPHAEPADVVAKDDARELLAMSWGLVPYCNMPFQQRIDR
jgi:hypothetical protein